MLSKALHFPGAAEYFSAAFFFTLMHESEGYMDSALGQEQGGHW